MCSMCHLSGRIIVHHYGFFRENENCDAKIVPYINRKSYHKINFCHIKILLVYRVSLTDILIYSICVRGA